MDDPKTGDRAAGAYPDQGYTDSQYPPPEYTSGSYPLVSSLGVGSFEVAMRGYHRRQVDRFVADAQAVTQDLEARLVQLSAELEWVRGQLADTQEELDRARDAAAVKPVHTQLTDRMAQILGLAHEEADQKLTAAEEHARRIVDEARAEAEDLRAAARSEA
ncbi:MAG: hypothetical protein GXX79_13165, partial [Actinomycetales bacterium]|nr:hypothetical protein [Actinomycetales bacterium]